MPLSSYQMSFNRAILLSCATAGIFLLYWTSEIRRHEGFSEGESQNSSQMSTYNIFQRLANLLSAIYNGNYFFLNNQHSFPETIFFIETSGTSKLNPRQACAVESTARQHPNSEVKVLMLTSEPLKDKFGLSLELSNVHLKSTNPESIFIYTPLWNWYQRTKWKSRKRRTYDLSDAIRALLIWKHGGMYLDLDFVSLKTLYGNRNFLVRSVTGKVCNGIFGFERRHPFLSKYLKLFEKRHKKDSFGSAGPSLFTEVSKSFCQHKTLEGSYKCNLNLLPSKIAFPVPWTNWRDYFNAEKTKEVLSKMRESYLIHVWNYLSSEQYLSVNSGTSYEKAIKDYCPIVYRHIVTYSSLDASFVF